MSEQYDLKDVLKNAKNPHEFIKIAWETSNKNAVAYGYIAGIIDALYYSHTITQDAYNTYYKVMGL